MPTMRLFCVYYSLKIRINLFKNYYCVAIDWIYYVNILINDIVYNINIYRASPKGGTTHSSGTTDL